MSRTTTAPAAQTGKTMPASQPAAAAQMCPPKDKVAMRAYQKWLQNGCPHGCDQQHWHEAEAELRAEMMKSGTPARK